MQEELSINVSHAQVSTANRRSNPRSTFTYPVEFVLFAINADSTSFHGYLKDISLSGACLQFEDRYGRCRIGQDDKAKARITLRIPREETIYLFAHVQWITKNEKNSSFKMGIAFKFMDDTKLMVIEKLMGLKNKDHNMMWNLWEKYEQNTLV
jgi:hypothetical protein